MARSLTVKHEETPGTSSLLNTFLALVCLWMLMSAIFSTVTPAGEPASPTSPTSVEVVLP